MKKALIVGGWIFTIYVAAANALYVIQTGNRLPTIGYILGGLALLFIFGTAIDQRK